MRDSDAVGRHLKDFILENKQAFSGGSGRVTRSLVKITFSSLQ